MSLPIQEQITFFYTADLAVTHAFYTEVMGLTCVLHQKDCRIYRVTPTSYVGFCQHLKAPRAEAERSVLFTIVTDQVDAWYARLCDHGVVIEKAPQTNETYQIYHFFCQDPNQYTIEVQAFLDPDWATHPVLER